MGFLLPTITGTRFTIRFFLCILLQALSGSCFAQLSDSWYLSKVLNGNNGLPQNSVRSMYFDRRTGFLWITTEAGLVRYDGANTRLFDLRDLNSLKSIRIFNLFPTVKGDILGCNRLGEIFQVKDNQPVNKPGYNRIHIYDFSYENGNARSITDLNIEPTISQQFTSMGDRITNALWLNDSVWIALSKQFIYRFKNEKLQCRWQKQKQDAWFIIARDSMVYVLNNKATGNCINLNNATITSTVTTDSALTKGQPVLFYDKLNDQPLLLNKGDLYEVNFKSSSINTRHIATLKDLPGSITSLIMHTNKKTVFVSTNSSGVYIYDQNPFTVYKAAGDDLLNNNAACVLTDSSHIFTSRSLLFDLNTGISRHVPVPINHTQSLGLDTSNRIWSAMEGNIISFNMHQPDHITRYPITTNNYLQTYYLSANKTSWISTLWFLGYVDNNEIKRFISYGRKPDSTSFFLLAETPDRRLAGVNAKGIFFINTVSKRFIPLVVDSALSQIRSITIDKTYRCWITTYGLGIFMYDLIKKKLIKFPIDDKGYLLYSHACVDDGYGNLLVPTNKGLFRLSKSNLLEIARRPATQLVYQYFDVSSGLLTNEFNGGGQSAFTRLPGGDVILPSMQGLVRVKINELPRPFYYPLFIDYIETKGKRYSPEGEIKFEKNDRLQVWYLSFAQWNAPNSEGLFYRTDEDVVWQRLPINENKIQLDAMAGGHHSLQIKYQYGLLPKQFSLQKFSFYIEKKYYETVWFWAGVFTLLVIVIYLITRLRHVQLKRKNIQLQKIIEQNTQELREKNNSLEETLLDLNEALNILKENSVFKNRLIGLLGHDMLVPLRFIANISDHLYRGGVELDPVMARESSGEIKNTASELLYLGESLIQWIKLGEGTFKLILKTINVEQLVNELLQVHKAIASVKNNTIICNIPSELSCTCDPVFIKMILHNLLLNANKFTSGGCTRLGAQLTGNWLTMNVEDEGTGMNQLIVSSLNNLVPVGSQKGTDKEPGWGMGYILIIDLLRFANGKLHVESTPGVGTNVSFSLPLNG